MTSKKTSKRRSQADRRQEAEARLIDAAVVLIAHKGFDGFALAEVGEAAGYSRGLPVHYFGTKENLLVEVARHVVDMFHKTIDELPPDVHGLPRLLQTIRKYVEAPMSDALRALQILIAHAVVHPQLKATVAELNARGLQVLENEIRIGIESGNVRANVNGPETAKMIYAFLRGQLSFAVLDPKFDSNGVMQEFALALSAYLAPVKALRRTTSGSKIDASPLERAMVRTATARTRSRTGST